MSANQHFPILGDLGHRAVLILGRGGECGTAFVRISILAGTCWIGTTWPVLIQLVVDFPVNHCGEHIFNFNWKITVWLRDLSTLRIVILCNIDLLTGRRPTTIDNCLYVCGCLYFIYAHSQNELETVETIEKRIQPIARKQLNSALEPTL